MREALKNVMFLCFVLGTAFGLYLGHAMWAP